MGHHGRLRDSFTFLCVDVDHTSQDKNLWTSMAYYGDSFNFLNVDDVHSSQEAWTTTVRYGDYLFICR
jgi:hypothetical protein